VARRAAPAGLPPGQSSGMANKQPGVETGTRRPRTPAPGPRTPQARPQLPGDRLAARLQGPGRAPGRPSRPPSRPPSARRADDLRVIEAERLDRLMTPFYDAALLGDHRALDRVINLMERRARLSASTRPGTDRGGPPPGRSRDAGRSRRLRRPRRGSRGRGVSAGARRDTRRVPPGRQPARRLQRDRAPPRPVLACPEAHLPGPLGPRRHDRRRTGGPQRRQELPGGRRPPRVAHPPHRQHGGVHQPQQRTAQAKSSGRRSAGPAPPAPSSAGSASSPRNPQKLDYGEGWHAIGQSVTKPEALQGHHSSGPLLNIVDEASGVEGPRHLGHPQIPEARQDPPHQQPLRSDGHFYETCLRAESDPSVRLIRVPSTGQPRHPAGAEPPGPGRRRLAAGDGPGVRRGLDGLGGSGSTPCSPTAARTPWCPGSGSTAAPPPTGAAAPPASPSTWPGATAATAPSCW